MWQLCNVGTSLPPPPFADKELGLKGLSNLSKT